MTTTTTTTHETQEEDHVVIEGFLWLRIHVRRRRYCVLRGRSLHVFHSKEDSLKCSASKKTIVVIGVKDANELDKNLRQTLVGSSQTSENALVISTRKSKVVVVEAETLTEKQRWFHAMNCLNFASSASEKSFFVSMLDESTQLFDAHVAVALLHKYRDNAIATELIIDRLAQYAEVNIDDVEFYIPQIMHLIVNLEMTKTEKLVNLLLSICKSKAYVEHLGNSIHLALQLFWLLEAKIQDHDPKTYNLCAKLLMSIEAKVVNQQFEVPRGGDGIVQLLESIPGIQERLFRFQQAKITNAKDQAKESSDKEVIRPEETTTTEENASITRMAPKELRELLLEWIKAERQKRYKYFHQQRDFVTALTDISERMRRIEPPSERKKHLPKELLTLKIPAMAYIPLGRVSDPFCRITRVLTDEGTVFSTHSRAPCLICFEVLEDDVNAAGQRPKAKVTKSLVVSPRASSKHRDSIASLVDEECEVAHLLKKYSINGTYIRIEKEDKEEEDEEDEEDEQGETEATEGIQTLTLTPAAPTPSTGDTPPPPVLPSPKSSTGDDDVTHLLRQKSKTAYELGLSRLLTNTGAFGESWQQKKERLRASSPYGHLPGWNVISLISKSNDDIRQEVFAMQLISKVQEIFAESQLPLYLRPYRIISTGKSCGLIETITDAQSLDALKKTRDYQSLRKHFERTYGHGDVHSKAFKTAQRNFLHSLVAYSIVCYLLQIKDRHNGNILLDTDGHLIHIDFGFMLGIAPGGNWSLETAPFKLTKEMVEVLGGVTSTLFGEFVQLFCRGLLAAQRNAEKIITMVEIMMRHSTFPCFQGRDVSKDLQKLRDRFLLHQSNEQVVKMVMKMIATSYKNKWTKRYDQFQKITNGILP